MNKSNPAGASIESGWLDKLQEQVVRLLTIIAEEDFQFLYDDEAVENPQNYYQAKTIFERYMVDWEAPDCPEFMEYSEMWASMRVLAQCLPLYAKIREFAKNKAHYHICRWFREVVTQEFDEIIKGRQVFVPKNQE